jgi:hypothetical protein
VVASENKKKNETIWIFNVTCSSCHHSIDELLLEKALAITCANNRCLLGEPSDQKNHQNKRISSPLS